PRQRYPSMGELAQALSEFLRGGGPARPLSLDAPADVPTTGAGGLLESPALGILDDPAVNRRKNGRGVRGPSPKGQGARRPPCLPRGRLLYAGVAVLVSLLTAAVVFLIRSLPTQQGDLIASVPTSRPAAAAPREPVPPPPPESATPPPVESPPPAGPQ